MIKHKVKDIISFLTGAMLLSLVLIASYFAYEKFDLTEDNRFTLADQTVELVEELQDVVEFKVYLTGEHLPADLSRIKQAIEENLQELNELSDGYIEYEFVDLYGSIEDKDELNKELFRVQKLGITIMPLSFPNAKGELERFNVPLGAEVFYDGNMVPLKFVEQNIKGSKNNTYKKAIESLEYEISNAIKKLVNPISKKVAVLQGHGELGQYEIQDLATSLFEYYKTGPITLKDQYNIERVDALTGIDLLIIAKPQFAFSEKEKYVLDQYIMNGGKTIWMVDGTFGAELDSLRQSGIIFVSQTNTGLSPLLYKYGAKVNTDIIEDLQCTQIPIMTTANTDNGRPQMFSWIYNPVVVSNTNHIITKNLDPIKLEFASSIDTVPAEGVDHTVLYQTSGRNRFKKTPTRVGFQETASGIKQELFKSPGKPVAVLLEGNFPSYFKNRISPKFASKAAFVDQSKQNKMIVISDGDIAKNWFVKGQMMPIGTNEYSNNFYDNKKFVLNCINYLTDDTDLITVRSKNVQMRLLDAKKVKENKSNIVLLNMAAPSGIILIIALIIFWIRKRKYAK